MLKQNTTYISWNGKKPSRTVRASQGAAMLRIRPHVPDVPQALVLVLMGQGQGRLPDKCKSSVM
jgi:hypothetical protein